MLRCMQKFWLIRGLGTLYKGFLGFGTGDLFSSFENLELRGLQFSSAKMRTLFFASGFTSTLLIIEV